MWVLMHLRAIIFRCTPVSTSLWALCGLDVTRIYLRVPASCAQDNQIWVLGQYVCNKTKTRIPIYSLLVRLAFTFDVSLVPLLVSVFFPSTRITMIGELHITGVAFWALCGLDIAWCRAESRKTYPKSWKKKHLESDSFLTCFLQIWMGNMWV